MDNKERWPEIEVHVCDEQKMQPGLTLVNFSNHGLGVPICAAVLDRHGERVWSYRRYDPQVRWGQTGNVADLRGDVDVRTTDEGVLIGGTNIVEGTARVHAALVSWRGDVLWECPVVNHHHIHRTPDGAYLFLIRDPREFGGTELVGDQVVEWDPAANAMVWTWRLFDHHAPEADRRDYSHANTIEPDPRDDSLIISCRNMNQLVKVDRSTGEIVWRLGVDGDFAMAPADYFYYQHSPELQPNGNILLFDNGTGRPDEQGGEFSRALELRVDEDRRETEAVWSYRHEPDLFCPIWSDADRLPNGNTLVTFGTRTEGDRTRYVEVTAGGQVVWDVELRPSGWGTYRAERILRETPLG
ncbi:MAG: aryl-sulfate sulfotransferase [Planctomycetota bacterium]